ncbi:mechanosensitive ion channel protein MscS [candidate division BRC1 bacterium SM23_51]|nr:MAG: mechanosensitive ion channel protein MscS [candidate division BRC1 bacterium SM23_51]
MDQLTQWMQDAWGISPQVQGKIFSSVTTILLIWLVRWLVLRVAYRRYEDVRIRYRWRKTSLYIAFMVGVIVVGRVWFVGIQSLSTFLGLVSAGMAIALRTPIVNLAGWAFILWRRPFEVGDRIEIDNVRGDVIDQRIFMFTMMEVGNWVDADQSTGRVIHVPNGKVFEQSLANYSKGFQYIWNEIPVLITFESNWRRAKELLERIATQHGEHLSKEAEKRVREAAKKFMIFYSKLTPTVYTSVRDCGVLLTIRYLCEPRRRRATEQAIWENVLDAFAESSDIDFAYPTQRFYDNLAEGKEGAKAENRTPSGDS